MRSVSPSLTIALQGIKEDPTLAPKAAQSTSTTANNSQIIKVKPEPIDDDTTNPISSGQKRKASSTVAPIKPKSASTGGIIILDDSSENDNDGDDDDIEFVSSKPALKKPKTAAEEQNENRPSTSIFKNAPLARTGSSNTSFRDEQKPIINTSSSSPIRPAPSAAARGANSVLSPKNSQRSIPDLSASSPSGRVKTESEIALERQLRRAEEKCRMLRVKSRAEPGEFVPSILGIL